MYKNSVILVVPVTGSGSTPNHKIQIQQKRTTRKTRTTRTTRTNNKSRSNNTNNNKNLATIVAVDPLLPCCFLQGYSCREAPWRNRKA